MRGVPIPDTMELYPFINLCGNRHSGTCVARVESSVITVGTPSPAHASISVRTRETCIYNHFLQTLIVHFLEISNVRIIPHNQKIIKLLP